MIVLEVNGTVRFGERKKPMPSWGSDVSVWMVVASSWHRGSCRIPVNLIIYSCSIVLTSRVKRAGLSLPA